MEFILIHDVVLTLLNSCKVIQFTDRNFWLLNRISSSKATSLSFGSIWRLSYFILTSTINGWSISNYLLLLWGSKGTSSSCKPPISLLSASSINYSHSALKVFSGLGDFSLSIFYLSLSTLRFFITDSLVIWIVLSFGFV